MASEASLSTIADVILCGHINLLPVAALLKKLTRRPLILEVYGIEAWERRRGLRAWGTEQVDLVIAIRQLGVMVDPESPDESLDGLEANLTRERHVPDCLARFDCPRFGRQIEELVATTADR